MTQAKTKEKKDLPPTKVVIRRLPPSLSKEEFYEQISPVPDHDYYQYVGPDWSLGQHAFCRGYINFLNHEDIAIFCEKFDGYVFIDSKGNEYPAMVEYAPFQKIPKKKKRTDTKKGTIEQDPDYVKFLDQLQNPQAEPPAPIEKTIEEIETREREAKSNHGVLKVSTPLLDFLKKRKEEKRAARQRAIEERKRRELERRKQKEEERRKRREREKEMLAREKEAKKEKRTEEGDSQLKILKKSESKKEPDAEKIPEKGKYGGRERKYSEEDSREAKSPTKECRVKLGKDRDKDWDKKDRDRDWDKPTRGKERDHGGRKREDREYRENKGYKDSKPSSSRQRDRGESSRGASYRKERRDERREDRRDEKREDRRQGEDWKESRDKSKEDKRENERDYDERRERESEKERYNERDRKEGSGRQTSVRDSKGRKPSEREVKDKAAGGKGDIKQVFEKGGCDAVSEARGSTSEKPSGSIRKESKPARFSATRAKESREAREDVKPSKSEANAEKGKSDDVSQPVCSHPVRRVRNKDRPERAIYVPGRRAAEKRKEEERRKEREAKEGADKEGERAEDAE